VLRSREILVVDDDPDIRDGLAEALTSEGYTVRTAADGEDALRQLRARAADLILLDLMMPVMDGWAFRAAQKRRPEIARIPLLVVTASGAEFSDADAVLRKPFELTDLLRLVKRCVRE
jgi:two-component system chemotaxis response regulator CheY